MADRIDTEGRVSFVQTLPRKVTELRATLGTLVADPKSQRMRDELRRRLHALYTLTRSYSLPTLSDGLREGIAHLDAVRGASILTQRDLETLADLIATLPALAQRDVPEQPLLFQRGRGAPEPTQARAAETTAKTAETKTADAPPGPSANTGDKGMAAAASTVSPRRQPASLPPIPPTKQTLTGMQANRAAPLDIKVPGLDPAIVRRPSMPPTANPAPLGVLVVGGAGLFQEVKRVLPSEADVTNVRALSEAVTAARDTAPDVIVAEAAAPADGLGLLAALRGDPLTDFLPVVLLASPADGIDAETAQAQGATELLPQPVDHARLRDAIERASQGVTQTSIPPTSFGDVTLEELTRALQEEIRRGIMGSAGPRGSNQRIALGQGSEVLAATWEAIARVREVVEKRTRGRVRFEMGSTPLGFGGAHVLSIGGDDDVPVEEGSATDDPLPGRTALVVDDDPGVVWFFAGLLREAGMTVTECTEGMQALKDARRVRPDVVISDILMPGIDGFALCRAIRRDVSLRHTPVILLSWKEDLLVRMRELGAQAQGFLRKESRGEMILGRVRAVMRPRVRLLRRIEALAEGAELRGRVERVGVFALLEYTARSLGGATLTVTDSFSVTELEIRDGALVAVIRTLQDGSLARGEGALLQVLGASNARFSLRRATHPMRPNVQGEISRLLAGGAALISALEDALSGASLIEVASIDLDGEAALAYSRSLPSQMRALVEKIVNGESPRSLVLNQGVAPQELEPVLVELARRGAIRTVRGPQGEDLVAPRYAAAQAGDSLRPGDMDSGIPGKDSGTMPAILKVPEAPALPHDMLVAITPRDDDEATNVDSRPGGVPSAANEADSHAGSGTPKPKAVERTPTPSAATESPRANASLPPWTPPTTIDEAAKPGFGLESEKDTLAFAVLRELREPDAGTSASASAATPGSAVVSQSPKLELVQEAPAASSATEKPAEAKATNPSAEVEQAEPIDDADDDTPQMSEDVSEEELSPEELRLAAKSSPGLPLEGVQLDARGLPRRSVVPDLPALDGPSFEPHEPVRAPKNDSPSSSIIIDLSAAALGSATPSPETPKQEARTSNKPAARISARPAVNAPVKSARGGDTSPVGHKALRVEEPKKGGVFWLAVAVAIAMGASYLVVRFVLRSRDVASSTTSAEIAPGNASAQSPTSLPAAEQPTVSPNIEDAASAAALPADPNPPGAPAAGAAMAAATENSDNSGDAGITFEDPARYLDGTTLEPGKGLLVIDGSDRPDLEISVNERPLGHAPARAMLSPGVHTVRYRNNSVVAFRFVPVQAGRATHVVVPTEP